MSSTNLSKDQSGLLRAYRRVFSISEIEQSVALKWFFGATLFSFVTTFDSWIGSSAITVQRYIDGQHLCWPWFTECGSYYFLEMLPYGYSHTAFYMFLMVVMAAIVYAMYRGQWAYAHMLMVFLLVWKFLVSFFLTASLAGNYDYYHIIFAIILLFLPHKLFFAQLSIVLFYTLSATAKIDATWILGTYFSALQSGLPLLPDWSIPVWTNLVMVMQIAGAWLLFSRNAVWQRLVLIYFVCFHFYSGILVEYRYPLTILPSLIIIFGLFYERVRVPLDRLSIPGWLLVFGMVFLQFTSVLIPGDERLTGEGNKYGMYMFEANHQCISTAMVYKADGTTEELIEVSRLARNRCEPYRYWFRWQQLCQRFPEDIDRIAWTHDHSLNGGPFYRIVDTEDLCTLDYIWWGHNDWIIIPEEGAASIGVPVKNQYY